MVANLLLIPVLHREIPQRSVIDPTQPAACAADQHPVRTALVLVILKPQLAEPTQSLIRLQHPEASTSGIRNPKILENLLQLQHLRLTAVGPETEPADQHQHHAVESAPPEQQHAAENDHQGGQCTSGGRGHLNATLLGTTDSPDQCLEDQSTIQRQTGKQVEQPKHQVEQTDLRAEQRQHWADLR